jgi:hypothetical protein
LESLRLLFGLGPYDAVHSLKDVEEVHTYVLKGIMAAMDLVAPAKAINVRRVPTSTFFFFFFFFSAEHGRNCTDVMACHRFTRWYITITLSLLVRASSSLIVACPLLLVGSR